MSNQHSDPAALLHELADEQAPASRMDVARAARDGLRLRHRRRTARSLTGVATAGAVAAAILLMPQPADPPNPPAVIGPGPCNAIPGTSYAPVGSPYRMAVAAQFGWLPGAVSEINEGPANYNGYRGVNLNVTGDPEYHADAVSASNPGVNVELTLYPYAALVPGQDARVPPACPSSPVDVTPHSGAAELTPAPDVNGGKAYWVRYADTPAGTALLVWQTTSGNWLSVSANRFDSTVVRATVEHIADTVKLGPTDLASPIQITKVPASAQMRVVVVGITRSATDGSLKSVDVELYFGSEPGRMSAEWVLAYPVGAVGPNPDVEPAGPETTKVVDGWVLVIEGTGMWGPTGDVTRFLPGGQSELLSHVDFLGAAPSRWSTELLGD